MATVSETNTETTLQLYANPLMIQDKQLSLFEEHVFDGKSVLDGNNVFTFGLEMGATLAAGIVNEMINNFQSLYPSRAQTMSDLYRHLSDYDYIDMFSTPSATTIELMFERNFLIDHAPKDEDESDSYKVEIPEFSTFTIGNHKFGIHYPINIKIRKAYKADGFAVDYDKCIFHCNWNTDTVNPLYKLTTNILEHRMYRRDGINFLCISIPIHQFEITIKKEDTVPSTGFIKRYQYSNRFYAIRVFHYWNNQWVELAETLSDVIYNPQIITAKVKVLSDIHTIEVSIPQVYFTEGLIGNRLMCMIYTTEGELDIDIRNYKTDQFDASFLIDDTVVDDRYSSFLKRVPSLQIVPLASRISSGSNGKTFEEMKNRVINTVGGDDLLITPKQLEAHLIDTGFKVSNYIDNITDRIYLASKVITDSNKNVVGSGEYMTTINNEILAKAGKEYDSILPIVENESYMLLPTSVFRYDEATDSMILLSRYERKQLLQDNTTVKMIEELNKGIYTFTPFHIKISTNSKLPMAGAFDLMKPSISNITFVKENKHTSTQTSMYGSVILHRDKGSGGYQFVVALYKTDDLASIPVSEISKENKNLVKENLAVILRTRSSDGSIIYMKGNYIGKNSDKYDLVEFNINTSYKVTEKDTIDTDSFTIVSDSEQDPNINYLSLNQTYELLFFAHRDFINDSNAISDSNSEPNIPHAIRANNMIWLATQQLDIKLGESISSLRANVFVTLTGKEYNTYNTTEYATYAADVYERYPSDVYDTNGIIIHHAGELMLDEDSKLIIKQYAGDLILSADSNSIGVKNPSCLLDSSSTDNAGNKINVQEVLYVDSEHRSPLAESSNNWYPFRACNLIIKDETTGKERNVWRAIYTGTDKRASVICVKDLLKHITNQAIQVDKASDRYRTFDSLTGKLNNSIESNFIYVKDDRDDNIVAPYWIYKYTVHSSDPNENGKIKYVLEGPDEKGNYPNRDVILTTIESEAYGAIYQRIREYSEFDYTQYLTESELRNLFEDLDLYGNSKDQYLLDKYSLDSDTLLKLKNFRSPWIKIAETHANDFTIVQDYWANREYTKFNKNLVLRMHDNKGSVSGLEALAYLQERAQNQNTINQYESMSDGIQAADNDNSYRLIWVDHYDKNEDHSNAEASNSALIDDLGINISENETMGALLFGTHISDNPQHYVLITGPSLISCYNRLMSSPTSSGYLYETKVYNPVGLNLYVDENYDELKFFGTLAESPIERESEADLYTTVTDIITSWSEIESYIAIQGDANLDFMTTKWDNVWPWELDTWSLIDGRSISSEGINIRFDKSNTDAKVLHYKGDILLNELGKPAEASDNERKIIYHVNMIHCDYKLIESTQSEYSMYKEDVQELLRNYFNVLEDTRPLLLERTNLYYSPIKSMGYGEFKGANGEIVLHPLEIVVSLRLHIPPAVGGSDNQKELIKQNVIKIVEDHISSGNISCTVLANQIRNSMSDSILYVDVLGINGDQDVQTLISADSNKSSVRLKQLLTLDDDGSINVEKGVTIDWKIMQ